MKNKIISIIIIYLFLFTSLISVEAAAPSPRVDLDDYEINSTNKDNIYVSGTVNMAKGQNIGLFDSTGKIPLNYTTVKNTESAVSFKIQVPSVFLNGGTNTFKVISLPVRGMLNASSPKTVTIKIVNTKKNQTITADNIELKINEKKNLNAKVNSNLPLTYISENPNIATVDANGNVVGRKTGNTKIIISQAGNNQYNPTNKTINITVKEKSSTVSTKNTYTVIFNSNGGTGSVANQKIEVGKATKLNPNKFTRKDYKFMGWAIASDKDVIKGKDIRKWKNVNMKHFQLGKVTYKDNATVKNLAQKNKQIVLYAVWKGNGSQAAVDWGKYIANDNNFHYNKWNSNSKSHTCPLCKNRKTGRYYGWNCMGFAAACWYHGGNMNNNCSCSVLDDGSINKIYRTTSATKRLNIAQKEYGIKNIKVIVNKKGIPKSQMKPGDILVKYKGNTAKHVVLYIGDDSIVDSRGSSGKVAKKNQISYRKNDSSWKYKILIRYIN